MHDVFIIEAPGKVRVFQDLLRKVGVEAKVQATNGHICEFPKEPRDLGIDQAFRPFNRILKNPETGRYIREALTGAKNVFIATDADQEGDVIAWDVAELIADIWPEPFRVRLKGMDEDSVREAITDARAVRKEDAVPGRTRAILDRMIGFTLSHKGVKVGRIRTPLLGICRDENLPVARLRLIAPSKDRGRPWVAECDVLDPITLKIAKQLENVQFPELDKRRQSQPYTSKPKHTGEVLVRAGDVLQLKPHEAQQKMQDLYESGKMSYPRAGSKGLSPTIAAKIAEIVKKSRYNFEPANVATKTDADVHDAPYPIGAVNVTHDPEKVGDHEGMRVLIARDLVKAGQSHIIEEAFGSVAGDHLRKLGFSDAVSDFVAKLPWRRENGPRYPGQEAWPESQVINRLPETVLLEAVMKKGLGRPSTWARHVEKFMEDGLVDNQLKLTGKGKAWAEASPEVLLDPRLSAAIESACERVTDAIMIDPNREPWELLSEKIIKALPADIRQKLIEAIADVKQRPKIDLTAMYRSTVGLDEVLEAAKEKTYSLGPKAPTLED
ncbi:DNA topoisomerase [Rhizobium sp. MHM7A]|uniref:DNA topoisomerase n=1 Tax=Rhizobium sp. MHM7A TaxID=2583233 RepID=UPI0011060891|nr:DNA topoisomerase [Rhizobium sp. MHM7A]TLX16895.1 type IA DNA topoisomerase [Rhizobium sp. MHM7A]